ncbi:MAG: glycoside hydrolase family 3 N-terminal domain-containing protein [Hyphomicrobium sp.]
MRAFAILPGSLRVLLTGALLGACLPAPDALARKARPIVVAKARADMPEAAAVPNTATASSSHKIRQLTRAEILATDRDRLERIGRHIVIGYHSLADVKELVAKRAIAGIFITDHNVRGRTAASIKADIDALQAVRKEQGLPPLIVAADQEGGSVSRLSPPLRQQAALGRILSKVEHDDERRKIVEDYARLQADELGRMGVTMNFGPVVDLMLNPSNRSDGETRLRLRAISKDPYTVAKVAGWYCDTLAQAGIMCTLKHFPGLGRVTRDTHVASAEISASEGTLELNDWVPFRRVMKQANVVTMLGHVRVGVLDKAMPASFSQAIIGTLVRQGWEHDGLLITDDFSMGAVTRSKTGIGQAAVKSLNAGTDFVLLSYTEKHLDELLSALIAADEAGEMDAAVLNRSRDRIERILASGMDTGPEASAEE